jgi:5'-phosphate synthase pdxT subunit
MRIGVLALQGDFEAHRRAVERAGSQAAEVRTAAQLDQVDALIIPGGESTTMLKLLRAENLFEKIRQFGAHKPIFGTCAGAILLAEKVTSPEQESLALLDIRVERNAYGRQIDSRIVQLTPEPEAGLDSRPDHSPHRRRRPRVDPLRRRSGSGGAGPPHGRHIPSRNVP